MYREAEMRQEFDARRRAIGREVVELQQQRAAARRQIVQLAEACNQGIAQLDEMRERLKDLHTRRAVTEKRLKETRTAISLLRRRQAEIRQEALAIQEEFAALEAEFVKLGQQKAALGGEIPPAESALQEILETITSIADTKEQVLATVAPYESKREGLAGEIAQKLSTAGEEERERIDELNDITRVLMNHIADRDRIKNVLEERTPALAGLRASVAALEQRHQGLDEAKALAGRQGSLAKAIAELKQENDAMRCKIEEQRQRRSAWQQELEGLIKGNAEKADTIANLESTVGSYDELTAKIADTKSRLAELSRSNEGGVMNIKELFDDSIRWEGECRRLEEMLKAMNQWDGALRG